MAAGVVVSTIYWSAASYGAITVMQVLYSKYIYLDNIYSLLFLGNGRARSHNNDGEIRSIFVAFVVALNTSQSDFRQND